MTKLCKKCGKESTLLSWETECYSCRQKAYQDSVTEQIASGEIAGAESESDIYCPYCGHFMESYADNHHLFEAGDHNYDCDKCEKEFTIETEVSFAFSTRRKEEN